MQVASGGSYFAASEPPLLLHLWSLTVEEQFYLLWPLLLLMLWKLWRGRAGSAVPLPAAFLVLAAALLSGGLMALQFSPGADPSRLYFGTDTHGFGLLLGAWLALAGYRAGPLVSEAANRIALPAGLAALEVFFGVLHDDGAAAYRGGMFAFSAVAVFVVALLRHPSGAAAQVLSSRQPQWLGRRSYGIYLWHWLWTVLVAGWLPAGADYWAAARTPAPEPTPAPSTPAEGKDRRAPALDGKEVTAIGDLLAAIGPDRRLVLVTAHGERPWVPAVNDALRAFAGSRDNVELRDWDSAARRAADFAPDGIHPGPQDGAVYAGLVRNGE